MGSSYSGIFSIFEIITPPEAVGVDCPKVRINGALSSVLGTKPTPVGHVTLEWAVTGERSQLIYVGCPFQMPFVREKGVTTRVFCPMGTTTNSVAWYCGHSECLVAILKVLWGQIKRFIPKRYIYIVYHKSTDVYKLRWAYFKIKISIFFIKTIWVIVTSYHSEIWNKMDYIICMCL